MHVGMSYGDPNAGLHAAFAVLSALFYRARTGKGQYIDMSQQESTMAVLGEGFMEYGMNAAQPPRNGKRVAHMAAHGVFICAGEDRWLSIAGAPIIGHDNDDGFGELLGLSSGHIEALQARQVVY